MKTNVKKSRNEGKYMINGHVFETLNEAKIYAYTHLDCWISKIEKYKGVFLCDVTGYERQDQM